MTDTPSSPSPDAIIHHGTILATVAPDDTVLVEPKTVRYQLERRDAEVRLRVFDATDQAAGSVPLVPGALHQLIFHGWVAPGRRGKAAAVLVPPTSIRKIVGHARRVFPDVYGAGLPTVRREARSAAAR